MPSYPLELYSEYATPIGTKQIMENSSKKSVVHLDKIGIHYTASNDGANRSLHMSVVDRFGHYLGYVITTVIAINTDRYYFFGNEYSTVHSNSIVDNLPHVKRTLNFGEVLRVYVGSEGAADIMSVNSVAYRVTGEVL